MDESDSLFLGSDAKLIEGARHHREHTLKILSTGNLLQHLSWIRLTVKASATPDAQYAGDSFTRGFSLHL